MRVETKKQALGRKICVKQRDSVRDRERVNGGGNRKEVVGSEKFEIRKMSSEQSEKLEVEQGGKEECGPQKEERGSLKEMGNEKGKVEIKERERERERDRERERGKCV